MKNNNIWKLFCLIAIINFPQFSFAQELKDFQDYYDNKEKLDEIEGIYLFNYLHSSNMQDTYNHTNEKTNDSKKEVMAIKGNGNFFYVYTLNEETNLFRKWEALTIIKTNNLYRISMTDEDFYNFNTFAILGNSFTLSLNRRMVIGQFTTESEYKYIVQEKLYPKAGHGYNKINKSGTCFLISSKGYLVTNYHVVKDAKNIYVTVVSSHSKRVKAELINFDEELDIAILKIGANKKQVPYTIKNKTTEVGTSVFTLGFPLTQMMGNEIKLSVGIINSKSGFKGDSKYYQISNPIQPGNSGGPLFDNQGNLIGLVTAKYTGGDNVGYALKSNLILNYLESLDIQFALNQSNKISKLPIQSKYKSLKDFVYFVEVE